jgi:hypothetical protein
MALISKMIRLMVINIFEHLIGDISPKDIIKDAPDTFKFKSGQSPLSVSEIIENVARCVFGYVISENALLLPKTTYSWRSATSILEQSHFINGKIYHCA